MGGLIEKKCKMGQINESLKISLRNLLVYLILVLTDTQPLLVDCIS